MKSMDDILPKYRDGVVVLVSGSRHATMHDHGKIIRDTLDQVKTDQPVTLVHGGCRGVDKICVQIAKERGWVPYPVNADWSAGTKAGPLRNTKMINVSLPHYAFVFPTEDSTITYDCKRKLDAHIKSDGSRLEKVIMVKLDQM